MPQPTWVTSAGNFGTYTEGVPVAQTFVAIPSNGSYTLQYTILNGINEVYPPATVPWVLNASTGLFTGTPEQVEKTTIYDFTIRVKEYNGTTLMGFTDRTFTFTVEGVTPPTFITPAGPLYPGPTYLPDSTWNPYQIMVNNPDPGTVAVVRQIGGSLPPGLEIRDGLIRGYADPSNANYTFTLEVESLSGIANRTFSIQVVEQTPSTREPAILNTQPPSYDIQDTDPNAPYYLSDTGDIGIFSQQNYFIFRVLGESFNSGSISYSRTGTLPPGLVDNIDYRPDNVEVKIVDGGSGYVVGDQIKIPGALLGGVTGVNDMFLSVAAVALGEITSVIVDSGLNVDSAVQYINLPVSTVTGIGSGAIFTVNKINAGWILGTITDDPTLTVETYMFTYTALNNDNSTSSTPTTFSMVVVAQENNIPFDIDVIWQTPENLGQIVNGSISALEVQAYNAGGLPLEYTLSAGTLPPDLTLNSDGTISGIVAWETGAGPLPIPKDTEIDYTFVVVAENPTYPEVTSTRTFTLTVVQEFDQPYDNLYIRSYFDLEDRAKLASLLQDEFLIPQNFLYRPLDPNFGKASDVVYQHMYGVPSSEISTYVSAVEKNHYRRNLILGPIRTAIAKDVDGVVEYEVVYSEIVDNLVNNDGVSINKQVSWNVPINGTKRILYPNSLPNMRQQIKDTIGYNASSKLLPLWMSCQQENGSTIGYIPVWVICYTKPGYSQIIKNNILSPFVGTFPVIATSAIDNSVEIVSTAGFYRGMRIKFSGTSFGNITVGMQYYVHSIIGEKHFTITTSLFNGPVPLFSETGEMSVEHVPWLYTLNILNFRTDRFEVGKSVTYDYDPATDTWSTFPSGVDQTDSHDQYVFWQKNILGNN